MIGWMIRFAKDEFLRNGWLDDRDSGIQELRDLGIIEEKWYGSLLEQYAGFLSWFKREFEGRYWHCLACEIGPHPREIGSAFHGAGRLTQTKKKVRGLEGKKIRR